MKYIGHQADHYIFWLSPEEKGVLGQVLDFYPLLKADYHTLSHSLDDKQTVEDEEMLQGFLTEEQELNRQSIREFAECPRRWMRQEDRMILSLTHEDVLWLVEILNNIRVGSWVALGSPDEGREEDMPVTRENVAHLQCMNVCGFFQSWLLSALDEEAEGG